MSKFEQLVEQVLSGIAKGKTVEDIATKHDVAVDSIKNELFKGVTVEAEHTESEEQARKIAMDHLWEMPDYYTKLKRIENK